MDTKHTDDIRYMMGSLGGKFNVITGINGSGKTRHLELFYNNEDNKNVIFFNSRKEYNLYVDHNQSFDYQGSRISNMDIFMDLKILYHDTTLIQFIEYIINILDKNNDIISTDGEENNSYRIGDRNTEEKKYFVWNVLTKKEYFSYFDKIIEKIIENNVYLNIDWRYVAKVTKDANFTIFEYLFGVVDTISLWQYFCHN